MLAPFRNDFLFSLVQRCDNQNKNFMSHQAGRKYTPTNYFRTHTRTHQLQFIFCEALQFIK